MDVKSIEGIEQSVSSHGGEYHDNGLIFWNMDKLMAKIDSLKERHTREPKKRHIPRTDYKSFMS